MQEFHRRGILNTAQDRALIVEVGILQGVVAGDALGGHDCRLTPVREEIAASNVSIGATEDRYYIRRISCRWRRCCHHRLGTTASALIEVDIVEEDSRWIHTGLTIKLQLLDIGQCHAVRREVTDRNVIAIPAGVDGR